MRNRTWSNVILAAMIASCISTVAKPESPQSATIERAASTSNSAGVAASAHSLAVTVMLGDQQALASAEHALLVRAEAAESAAQSAADRAMNQAAVAAGNAVSSIEMPFFSFGGGAGVE